MVPVVASILIDDQLCMTVCLRAYEGVGEGGRVTTKHKTKWLLTRGRQANVLIASSHALTDRGKLRSKRVSEIPGPYSEAYRLA